MVLLGFIHLDLGSQIKEVLMRALFKRQSAAMFICGFVSCAVYIGCSGRSGSSASAQSAQGSVLYLLSGNSDGSNNQTLSTSTGSTDNLLLPNLEIAETNSDDNYPFALAAGKPYELTINVQTLAVPTQGPTLPGSPIIPGDLVLDLVWRFDGVGNAVSDFIRETAKATITLDAVNNMKSVTVTGNVPSIVADANGAMLTRLISLELSVNPATTAEGQAGCAFTMKIMN